MPDKTPAEKLRLKPGMSAVFLHLPEGMKEALGIPAGVTEIDDPAKADFIIDFASTQAEAEERLTALARLVGPKIVAWMVYPKGSKAAGYDVSRDTLFEFVQTVGLILNANIAIDDTFSAVRMRPM